jgi:Icc-related predicted phosphoesterase
MSGVKIRILSDLHLDADPWSPPEVAADVVVLAGDVQDGGGGIAWAREQFPGLPVLYVPGNHELYGGNLDLTPRLLREEARHHDVHLLDCGEIVIRGVRFLGCTLWANLRLCAADHDDSPSMRNRVFRKTKSEVERLMSDYRQIRQRAAGAHVTVDDLLTVHHAQRDWLRRALARPFNGKTVVITHHAPHPRSIDAMRRKGNDLAWTAYASDLRELLVPPVGLWIHGHVHDTHDYVVGGTRVICNPRGYLPSEPNSNFDPTLVVEV